MHPAGVRPESPRALLAVISTALDSAAGGEDALADDPRAMRHGDGNASPRDAAGIGVSVSESHLGGREKAAPRVPLRF